MCLCMSSRRGVRWGVCGPDINVAHRRKGWVKEQLVSFLECVKFEIAWSPAACFSSVSSCSARLMVPSPRAAALGVEVAAKWSCSCQCQMTPADVVVGRAFWSKTGLKIRVIWGGRVVEHNFHPGEPLRLLPVSNQTSFCWTEQQALASSEPVTAARAWASWMKVLAFTSQSTSTPGKSTHWLPYESLRRETRVDVLLSITWGTS